ncbi:hypothetical protein [Mesorhizobium sp.]|uniref:hypothetical protein n=1 Tax=Mesorhizobium sp. TaxID=1871066 RepID=UPI000FE7AFEE|nr:hypothetical protein [Mesorhizobium sp.]RWQ57346.1 MAG: hypothetical protein EOS84_07305 [Mesorhizobium sp.]
MFDAARLARDSRLSCGRVGSLSDRTRRFQKACRPVLFWLLALQFLTMYLFAYAGEFLANNDWFFLAGLFKAFGAMAFMTIGVIPLIALPLSVLIALAVLAFRLFRQAR